MNLNKLKKLPGLVLASLLAALAVAHAQMPLHAGDSQGGRSDHHGGRDDDHDGDDHDHDRALGALQRGEVIPLENVLAILRATTDGTVVSTKLEREDNKWLYEMKVIGRDGRLRKIRIDAKTGAVLASKEHD